LRRIRAGLECGVTRPAIPICVLGLVLLAAAPVRAGDCVPSAPLASVDLLPGNGSGSRLLVPVLLDDTPRKLLLDTGGGFTSLTPDAANELGLVRQRSNQRLLDLAGHASRDYVHAGTLSIGGVALDPPDRGIMNMWITPSPDLGSGIAGAAFDGILADDMLTRYDIDIDFPARQMKLFSQDHCPGDVVYWQSPAVAVVPFTMQAPDNAVPGVRRRLSFRDDTHIRVPVMLDGKRFMAVVDTGAMNSTISARAARQAFGIDADSPGSQVLGMIDSDPAHRLFLRIFSRMEFEGVAVIHPHLEVIPDLVGTRDPDNGTVAGSRIRRMDDAIEPSVTIGMDVLRHLHLYIAFQERKLYISIADPGATVAAVGKPAIAQ
jgi:hypothetical protein